MPWRSSIRGERIARCYVSSLFLLCWPPPFVRRMVGASDAEIRLMADDTWAELVLPLREDFAFGYADMRDAPEEADLFVRGIMIFFPYEGDPEQADRIVLAELVE